MAVFKRTFSVAQLNDYVNGLLTNDPMLRNVRVSGEVSNFRITASGHAYFALKDGKALVRCAMFRPALCEQKVLPKEGDKVTAVGSVGIYSADGQYQLYVRQIELAGAGELFERFEKLKAELAARGWFDASIKKPLPLLPRRVGVVTSETGAVIHDIQNVAARRFPDYSIVLAPSAVQGAEAAEQIMRGIAALDKIEDVDVIIVARGGGSVEDLWPFNEEVVAEAIYHCRTPVVSAVGHETDFTIADFVADLRAPTPSAAAEQVFPRKRDLQDAQYTCLWRMEKAMEQLVNDYQNRADNARRAMQAYSPAIRAMQEEQRLDGLITRLLTAARTEQERRKLLLDNAVIRLDSASPLATLHRGYVYVSNAQGVVSDAAQLTVGEQVELKFRDGKASARIEAIG